MDYEWDRDIKCRLSIKKGDSMILTIILFVITLAIGWMAYFEMELKLIQSNYRLEEMCEQVKSEIMKDVSGKISQKVKEVDHIEEVQELIFVPSSDINRANQYLCEGWLVHTITDTKIYFKKC